MTTIVTRAGKGSPLTNNEMDTNLTNLNTDKLEVTTAASTYAPIDSPTFTGDPRAPTPVAADNDTSIATTAYVTNAVTTSPLYVKKSGDTMTGQLWAFQGLSFNVKAGASGGSATGVIAYRSDGTTISGGAGVIHSNGVETLAYLGAGTSPWSAGLSVNTSNQAHQTGTTGTAATALTRKDYVDGQTALKVSKSGDTMTGQLAIDMSQSSIAMKASGSVMGYLSGVAGTGLCLLNQVGSVAAYVPTGTTNLAVSNGLSAGGTISGPKVIARNSGATTYSSAQLEINNAAAGAAVIGFHREGSSACVLSHNGDGLIVGANADGGGAQTPLRVTGTITTDSSVAGTNAQIVCSDNGTLAATMFSMPVAGQVTTSVNFALNRGNARWFAPGEDGTYFNGWGLARWNTIYIANAPVVGSDERLKTPLKPLTDAELKVASVLAKNISSYQWLAKVAVEGDKARQHIGLSAQFVEATFAAHGLDARKYSMFCYDSIESAGFKDRSELPENIRDTAPDDRYSLRYEQLAMFICAGQEQRLAALEAALNL